MKQEDLVLDYMKKHNGITSIEAFNMGITRLSAKIFNLREHYVILDEWIEAVNRYGNPVRFKRYFYVGAKN